MGLWISFALFAAVFVLIGWSMYSTHRQSPAETIVESRSPVVRYLDAVDCAVVLVVWFTVILAFQSWIGLSRTVGLALLLCSGSGAVWLRRRLFPGTVARFHRDNLAIRCASLLCGLGSLIALMFGGIARLLEEPTSVAWSFFLTAAGLMFLAVWFHAIELRRRPHQG